ncbi:DHA2 family efflux MFS transporter permease subunit [Actinophytocola oryzae]|uniref:EmrB/QacA subfamily drug resistance transporter n=1 Tax=Actinophytocola oryzae TaxID=502181 RepID=A0A4R7W1P8_9PSEU|nr:DHA2 family efflux MFS transporter permease subunit [Actinophytocola oryzae]TDV56486.1 EmrB/QacA subfamily drug resistance transporter [Actinophytocola oryzae]
MTKRANPWAALIALCVGFFMILLDTTIVTIAIPSMVRGLDTDLNSVVWVISIYLLVYAVLMLFTSRLGDRFGPKRVYLAGMVVFTAASLWCGLSGTAETLIAARGLQGLGAALMTPQTLSFITHLFPPAKRGPAMGMWGGIAGLATITGPLLGGVLVDSLGWEWIFFVNVPIGVVGIVLAVVLVPDWKPGRLRSFDVPGILLSVAGLGLLVFGIQNGQHFDWGQVRDWISIPEIIAAGVVLLIAFVFWQRYNRGEPLVPLRVFGNRNFSTGTATATAIGFAMTGMFVPLVLYTQSVLGLSPTKAGLLTAPMSLLSGMIAPFIGRLSDRGNAKYLVMTGFLALATGLGLVALISRPDTNPWTLVPALLVAGVGTGFVFAPMSNITMRSVEPALAGTASGIFNTSRQVGGVLGSAAIGVLLQARISASMTDEATEAARSLPPEYRETFVNGVSQAASSANELGPAAGGGVPSNLPSEVADQIQRLATQVVHNGLTDATRESMILPIAVLLIGALTATLMRRNPAPEPPRAPEPTPDTAPTEGERV